jgi:hypothetical protein
MNKLTEQDYEAAAKLLGCEIAAIKAVAEVESHGEGFYPDGFPVILFERHKFHQFTNGRFDKNYPEISNHSAGGYGPAGENQKRKFKLAYTLDPIAALKSCSWGKFQIMGFNFASCGHNSVVKFVDAMKRSEGEQLQAFCKFVIATGLDGFLRAKNWARLARGYNGPDYAENHYDTKLEAAYKKHLLPNKQTPPIHQLADTNQPDTTLVSNDGATDNSSIKPDNSSDFLVDAVDKNVSADQLKTAGKSAGSKAWRFLIRPLSMFYTALEAGNIAAWLGVVVLIIAIGLLLYWHRADIKKLVDKLKAKLTS